MKIRNTAAEAATQDGAMLMFIEALGSNGNFAERQEAAGQRQLVASEQLPTDRRGTPDDWASVGFTFADAEPGDPLFCKATLPDGWTKRPTEHSMWSEIVDQLGRVRVKVFYKAAFYDRRANARLVSPDQYVWSEVLNDQPLVFDDTWLTPQSALLILAHLEKDARERAADAERATQHATDPGYWRERAAEHYTEADQFRRVAEGLATQVRAVQVDEAGAS